MKFKSEFVNVVKLFFLLSLLFWSFTWNLSPEFDLPNTEPARKRPGITKDCNNEATVNLKRQSDFIQKISSAGYSSGKSSKSSSSGILIPSFNEWKEKEKKKYERSPPEEIIHNHKKSIRRKLNYASSKCGAKILSSNPEARHRNAILSEKSDEYMLNPCKVRTWFILELCDTVEATQFELANYELYSSPPREFSVFWSEVYPTMVWNLLGTFEAKDQRTMQTFELKEKNLGKFIKVIIYNHHGKEHFCPLSVIRVLGYSMVEKLEDMAQKDNNPNSNLNNENDTPVTVKPHSEEKSLYPLSVASNVKHVSNTTYPYLTQLCPLLLENCSKVDNTDLQKLCSNKATCRFLREVLEITMGRCLEVFCYESPESSLRILNDIYKVNSTNISSFPSSIQQTRISTDVIVSNEKSENEKSSLLESWTNISHKMSNENTISTLHETTNESSEMISENSSLIQNQDLKEGGNGTASPLETSERFTGPIPSTENKGQEKCTCETNVKPKEAVIRELEAIETKYKPGMIKNEETDSAGLHQKESVLFKMTSRIIALEVDLNLINKYLEQLSQSYFQQMTNMKAIINHTVVEMSIASEKARATDKKQEESLDALKEAMKILSKKTEYLMNGQKDLLKRVVELHGFFLILELIIISTIFTIFLNIFRHNNNISLDGGKK